MGLVILSQFTGLYYSFDEMNRYQRAPGFFISCVIPMGILLLELSVILQYHRNLRSSTYVAMLIFSLSSIVAPIVQLFMYGVSLNNMIIVATSALLFVFALKNMTEEVEEARRKEIKSYQTAQKKEHVLFEQTAEALANAIDAKDQYTHGHSTRVAMYAVQIAQEAGLSQEECEKVYFSGLLHDVGKIGVPDSIINKNGKLTEEEFAWIKKHPVFGNQILSSSHPI